MKVEKDYEEFLKLLNKHEVKYCIIGAYAVAFYAKPRFTKDIDILIEPNKVNANKIKTALDEFGFKSLPISEDDLTTKKNIIQLGYEPLRIDIITSLEGFPFGEIWENRVTGVYGAEKVFFISLDDLIKSKRLSDRPEDKIDITLLKKVKK